MFILYVLEEHRLKGKLKQNGLVMIFLKLMHIQSPVHCIPFWLWVVHVGVLPYSCTLSAIAMMSASHVALFKGVLYYWLWSFLPSGWHSSCMSRWWSFSWSFTDNVMNDVTTAINIRTVKMWIYVLLTINGLCRSLLTVKGTCTKQSLPRGQ